MRPSLLIAPLAALALATTPSRAAEETTVVMSPFEVSATKIDFQQWVKLSSPHFIVYTDAKPKEGREALRRFEMVRTVLEVYLRRKVGNFAPMRIVLPSARSDWKKFARKDNIEWRDGLSDPAGHITNLLLAQYDWQDSGLWLVHSSEFTRAHLHAMNLTGPLWFEEGIGMLVEAADFDRDSISLGGTNPRARHLARQGWIPWSRFFTINETSPEYVKAGEIDRLLGQWSIFAQFLVANPDAVWLDRMMTWNALLSAGAEPTEAEFKRVFGQDWKTWQHTMEQFYEGGTVRMRTMKFSPGALDFPVKEQRPPVREMRDLFVLAQVLNQAVPASEAALDSLVTRGLQAEEMRDLLVEAAIKWRRPAVALEQLRILIQHDSPNPAVFAQAAELRFQAAVPVLSVHASLGDAEDEIRAWCRQALVLEPRHGRANNLLAWVEAFSRAPGPDRIAAIEKIYGVLKNEGSTANAVTALAIAQWRAGDTRDARALGEALQKSPYTGSENRRLTDALLAELGPP